jgi:type IV pilus assembly protein PilB
MKKLGDILLEAKLIDDNQLESALAYQRNWGCKLGNALVELNFIEESVIAKAISQSIKIPYVNIFAEDFSDEELKKAKEALIRKYEVVPVKRTGNSLEVAMSDPTDLNIISDLQFAFGLTIKPVLALESEIKAFIQQYYSGTLVHRKSTKRALPEQLEVVHQGTVWENKSTDDSLKKMQKLVLFLVEKGVLTSEEAANILA